MAGILGRWQPGCRAARGFCSVLVIGALAACAGPSPRDPEVVAAIENDSGAFLEAYNGERRRFFHTLLERSELIARGETGDDTFDVLLFSGGAEWGAFGAGFTAAWSEQGDAAPITMPEFDMVGGISTGALMAGFVASGEAARYEALETFYRNVSPDWIRFRGIGGLLPGAESLVANDGVVEQVTAAVDDALIADLRQAYADKRLIMIGTVSLDYGTVRYWDIAEVAANHPDPKPRIVDILVGATAIAGVFPPVAIDGSLYADLGYVEGIPAFRGRNVDNFATIWRERNGETPAPVLRLWLVYNIPIGIEPEAVELSTVPLALRGYEALVQASFTNPVETAFLLQRLSLEHQTPRIEVRWIAIPASFEPDPDAPSFSPMIANPLADLGRAAAAEPGGGWRTEPPGSDFNPFEEAATGSAAKPLALGAASR